MSAGRLVSWVRDVVVARLLPRVFESKRLRSVAFSFVSELRIRYRRSAAISEGRPRLRRGPRAGARLPDADATRDGQAISLQRAVVGPHLALLLCGDPERWDSSELARLERRYGSLLEIHRLTADALPQTLAIGPRTLALLGARDGAQYLLRPDGYIAFRCGGTNLDALARYLTRWLVEPKRAHRVRACDT
jgi:hypothetical protein